MLGSPGVESEAGGGQGAVDEVGRYCIFLSLRLMMRARAAWSAAREVGFTDLDGPLVAAGAGDVRIGQPVRSSIQR